MMTHDARRAGVARVVASWLGIVLAAGWAPGPVGARDEPPVALSPAEKVAWWEAQCTKLGAEVEAMEALRKDHETGNRLMRTITLPNSGSLMYDRIQSLERDIARRPKDDPVARQLTAEFIPLRAQYVERMTQLIRRDEDLALRGIWDYDELVARSKRWRAGEARYPLAKAERVRACEESDRARLEQVVQPASPNFPDGSIIGRVEGFTGLVELLPEGKGKAWRKVTLNDPLVTGDVIRTGSDGRVRLEFLDMDLTEGMGSSVINMGPGSEIAINTFVVSFQPPKKRVALFDLIFGTVRAYTKGWFGGSSFSVRSGATVVGIRGTDVVIAYDPQRDHVAYFLREGRVDVSRGAERRALEAGQMLAVERGAFQPTRRLEAANWQRLVAQTDGAAGARAAGPAPGRTGPTSALPPGRTGPIGAGPSPATAPPSPSSVPAPPVTVPGSPSPRGVGPGTDVTRRDLPSGPLPRGGETRVSGDTFTVQSAPALQTHQEITARPVGDFQAATQVRAGGGGSAVAGLYVTVGTPAEGRAGDLFFGMDVRGIVLQRDDGAGWRDLPRQARGVEPSVRLEVLRRAGRYEFRWNGAAVGSAADTGSPMRVFLFAGPGVRAEFSRFSVVAGGSP